MGKVLIFSWSSWFGGAGGQVTMLLLSKCQLCTQEQCGKLSILYPRQQPWDIKVVDPLLPMYYEEGMRFAEMGLSLK